MVAPFTSTRSHARVVPGRRTFRSSLDAWQALVTAPATVALPLLNDSASVHTSGNRFLLAAIAFLRTKQLSGGARAQVPRNGHKPTYIAVLEVMADTISWSRI